MKDIDNQQLKCNHNKIYANYILSTNPPQHPWVCSRCGLLGIKIKYLSHTKETYEDVCKRLGV